MRCTVDKAFRVSFSRLFEVDVFAGSAEEAEQIGRDLVITGDSVNIGELMIDSVEELKLDEDGNPIEDQEATNQPLVFVEGPRDHYTPVGRLNASLKREHGLSPNGNPFAGVWVLRGDGGAYIDHDQYRNDLIERNNITLVDKDMVDG